jgi:phosphatidylserine decarboxylase
LCRVPDTPCRLAPLPPEAPAPRADEPAPVAGPRAWLQRVVLQEDLNFLLTNRIPRRLATRCMGWFSKLPTGPLTRVTIALWRLFAPDLDLGEARQQRFRSLHDCFVRELKPGARPIDPDPLVLTSPCDAIVGAHGRVCGTEVFQAKGFPYRLEDLLGCADLVARCRDGVFVTLRLKASFYHRFHAPCDAALRRVVYIAGDTWNVNPIALRRVERLFCKNERAALDLELPGGGGSLVVVAVAAILVASIRLHCLPAPLDLRYRGPNPIDVQATFAKGEQMGWFEHGSTLLVFAPPGMRLHEGLAEGTRIRVGQPLLRRGTTSASPDEPTRT